VKAVEYYVKEQLVAGGLARIAELTHFACTSEDINNTAYALMLRDGRDTLSERLTALHDNLVDKARRWAAIPMMARTHGQPATPTTVGKELIVFAARVRREMQRLREWQPEAKMNGATGNWNAHVAALPAVDWISATERFIRERLDMVPILYTTQINPYHYIAELLHILVRISQTLVAFDRDVWGYISLGYFHQEKVSAEVGSSTMPHKVNPIDFENSEGNCGIASALMEHLASKLLVSRFQRDLTDSTVLRNLGTAFAHLFIGIESTCRGLGKITINEENLRADLAAHPELVAEAIQTVMRLYGEEHPYERLKNLTRGERVNEETFRTFIASLSNVPDEERERLYSLTPERYIGLAKEVVERYLREGEGKDRG